MNILAEELKKLSDKSLSADEYAERERQFLRLYYDLREGRRQVAQQADLKAETGPAWHDLKYIQDQKPSGRVQL